MPGKQVTIPSNALRGDVVNFIRTGWQTTEQSQRFILATRLELDTLDDLSQ